MKVLKFEFTDTDYSRVMTMCGSIPRVEKIDKETGDKTFEPQYTSDEWVRERFRSKIMQETQRYEAKANRIAANKKFNAEFKPVKVRNGCDKL